MVLGIIDANSISFWLSLMFAIIALLLGFKKHKGFHYKIIFYVVSAYFLGSTIYPGLSILFYSSQNKTLMGETLDSYRIYFGLSGLLLILVALYGMYEMLKSEKITNTENQPLPASGKRALNRTKAIQ